MRRKRPADLAFLPDRDAEAWQPLFALLAVSDSLRLAELRKCAESLTQSKSSHAEDDSLSQRLLVDLREVWPEAERQALTGDLLARLRAAHFANHRGLFLDMPPLIVGHCYWDNWMIWKALAEGMPVIDGTLFMTPVHQNHGYSAASGRIVGKSTDALSLVNLRAIGGKKNVCAIGDATHCMTSSGEIRPNAYRHLYPLRRVFAKMAGRVDLPGVASGLAWLSGYYAADSQDAWTAIQALGITRR